MTTTLNISQTPRQIPYGRITFQAIRYLISIAIALIVIVPLATAALGGFKTTGELLQQPFGWPANFYTTNYGRVIASQSFWIELRNSTFVMVCTTVGVVVLASMPAFVFARLKFPGREVIFNFFTIGLLFPLTVAILPLYITLRQVNLIDNLWGII